MLGRTVTKRSRNRESRSPAPTQANATMMATSVMTASDLKMVRVENRVRGVVCGAVTSTVG